MKADTIQIYQPFSILDSLVGTIVNGDIVDVIARKSVAKTERQCGPETKADWLQIAEGFEDTAYEAEHAFEATIYFAAAKIARRRAEKIA